MPWPRESSEDDLVARLTAGDERAWAELYQELAGRIAGYARAKGVSDPDDLVGDVFAAAAERIGRFDGDGERLRSWMFTIAHHRLADDLRRRKRRATDAVAPREFDDLEARADSIGEATARIDADGALAMLQWVTEEQREVLTLRILGELSIAETATVMGKPPGAVKALQHRAIARIQRRLEQDPYPNAVADDDGSEP
ncbi:RNA polymerase sigma factor [Actinospongicola halichondriae]|uniref:RNA polymerase sigma factor n=1 Tax=Actinospongicola halichondriae TaxID=3236844 RepID=UPI003D44E8A0